MASDQEIRTALTRARKSIELRPSMARGTMTTSLRLENGVKCICRYGDWQFEIDEPKSVGGENTAPSPGVYAMSGLAGCIAITIKVQAIQAGLLVDAVNVDVEGDYDDRGSFRMDDVPPGFERFRLRINIESPNSEAEFRDIVDEAFSMSTWYNTFLNPQEISTEVSVNSSAGAESNG